MQLPGTPSLVYLAYLLLFLPWIAFRSARRLRAARDGVAAKPLPSREAIWIGTLVSLSMLFMMAWLGAGSITTSSRSIHWAYARGWRPSSHWWCASVCAPYREPSDPRRSVAG